MHGLYTLAGAGFVLVWLYEPLAGQLIDNYFDSGGLCDRQSDLVTPGATPRSGIGAQLALTKKKRKSLSVTSTTFALQGKCCAFPAKTTHILLLLPG
jgi:hypothetical protein